MERLLAAARKGDIPVIWAQVRYTHPSMLDAGIQIKKSKTITAYYEKDPRGYNLWLPGLLPDPEDTVIYKRNPSCFFGTTLPSDLHLMGIDTLVICGVSTSGCVRATAVDAICHGYRPMVSRTL
jgi:nicotinamidase-related amidase